jgi:hypothetical protein
VFDNSKSQPAFLAGWLAGWLAGLIFVLLVFV